MWRVRDKIREAEAWAGAGDFTAAMEHLAVAFELARFSFRSEEPYRRAFRVGSFDIQRALSDLVAPPKLSSSVRTKLRKALESIPSKKLSSGDIRDIVEGVLPSKAGGNSRRFERLLRKVVGGVGRVEERLEAVTVAGDPSEYAWFRRRVPRPTAFAGDGSELAWHTIPPDPPAAQREYLRALEFVTTTALRWQQFPRPETVEEEEEEREEDGDSEEPDAAY